MSKLFIIANNKVQALAKSLSDADRYCGAKLANVATHVDECTLSALEVFSDKDLLAIVSNHMEGDFSKANREALLGLVFKVVSEAETLTDTFKYPQDKAANPYQIERLSDAQRLAQVGDPTQAGKGASTAQRSSAPANAKRPKPGTASGRIWDKCDELLAANGFNAVKDAVMVWGQAEGINPSTVRTQYGHWRRFNNLG